ncbi:hypothetical protein ACMBCM_10425, partial [Spiroplasma sp. K1]
LILILVLLNLRTIIISKILESILDLFIYLFIIIIIIIIYFFLISLLFLISLQNIVGWCLYAKLKDSLAS